jgi:formylglycine-generating enzyme required for sulfatase activity
MTQISRYLVASLVLASFYATATSAEPDTRQVSPASSADLNTRIKELLTRVKHSLRPLKGGTFEMGDWGPAPGRHYDFVTDSRPLHRVTLDGFLMMAYKVTYDDFDVFTDATSAERVDMDEISVRDRAPKRPAGVSWYGAKAYCQWLRNLTNLPFDLPTEAQWEYAARSGGKRMLFATDNGRINRGRNFPKEWEHGEKEPPIPNVGSYPPNPAGLYGMSEDTSEWVNDWYDANYYSISPQKNPFGPNKGTMKVRRGSVGGTAEIAAMVFMRTKATPQRSYTDFPTKDLSKAVEVPFSGYSSYKHDNFRCVVNALTLAN